MKTRFSSTNPPAPSGLSNGIFAEVVENGVRHIAVHVGATGSGGGVDTNLPSAPEIAVLRLSEKQIALGVQGVGTLTNWNNIQSTTVQLTSDPTFATIPNKLSLDETHSPEPPFSVLFTVVFPGVYYCRARVTNQFGPSAWSATVSVNTDAFDNVDTGFPAAPMDVMLLTASSEALAGNAYRLQWRLPDSSVPVNNVADVWGHFALLHTSDTLPSTITQATGTDGEIIVGISRMTSPGTIWTPNEWIATPHDLVLFHPNRGGSPSWALLGMIWAARITANGANWIDINFAPQRQWQTLSGCEFWIVRASAGDHLWEQVPHAVTHELDAGLLRRVAYHDLRKWDVSSNQVDLRGFVALHGTLYGLGHLAGPTTAVTYPGITEGELGAGVGLSESPIEIVSALPPLPNVAYPVGFVVSLTTDGKLYRNVAPGVWTKAIDGSDVIASSVTSDKIFVGSLAAISANAGTLTSGSISANLITTGVLGASVSITLTRSDTVPAKFIWQSTGAMYANTSNTSLNLVPLTDSTGFLYIGTDVTPLKWFQIRMYTGGPITSSFKFDAYNTSGNTHVTYDIISNVSTGSYHQFLVDDINIVTITSVGLMPSVSNSRDLGSSVLKWRDGYFAGNLNVDGAFSPSNISTSGEIKTGTSFKIAAGGGTIVIDAAGTHYGSAAGLFSIPGNQVTGTISANIDCQSIGRIFKPKLVIGTDASIKAFTSAGELVLAISTTSGTAFLNFNSGSSYLRAILTAW